MLKPANRHRKAAMIAHSAVSASASGATRQRVEPEAPPTVGTIPKNGAYRNFQTVPTATGARTNGAKNTTRNNVRPAPRLGDEHGQQEAEARLEHDRGAREHQRVQQAPMEDRVAEERVGVVLEADEGRQVEALGVMHAEHDAVDQRVDQEAGQDDEGGHEEQQVDGAFAT